MKDTKKINKAKSSCCNTSSSCSPSVNRRQLLKGISAGIATTSGIFTMPTMAGPFAFDNNNKIVDASDSPIPLDKKLDKDWVKSLYARGEATTYKGWQQLQYIGMPIGGIGSGTVYIGGDGKLWVWDIFNENHEGVVPQIYKHPTLVNEHGSSEIKERNGANYINPPAQTSPWHFEQGFAIKFEDQQGKEKRLTLDRNGFDDITFTGQQPIAEVLYKDAKSQLEVKLEAMTPFIPLDTDRSSYPATIMSYSVTNKSNKDKQVKLEGWYENPVLNGNDKDQADTSLYTTKYDSKHGTGILATASGNSPDANKSLQNMPNYGSFALHSLDKNTTATVKDQLAHLQSDLQLKAGETKTVSFIISWYFPNQKALFKKEHQNIKRWYASKYDDAKSVALDIAHSFDELTSLTRLWRDTWYDSTLPHWLLERSIIPTNALQTNTSYRLDNGRFWAWEGVGCCGGTCTHVWHYAQAVGRLFPDLERDLRERTDYGLGFKDNGAIRFRGEYGTKDATDGQAGVILRTYREHQMSPDSAFLNRVWPKAKKALQYLILVDARSGMPDGIPEGEQHNTLDAEWYGKIPVLSSLYIASLRAGEEMAKVVGDKAFAKMCHEIYQLGENNILKLFNPEHGFFTQDIDPNHKDAIGIGEGCYIDQVMGQWWGNQLNLGRLYDGKIIRSALSSLWDYNFCPDMGPFRDSIETPSAKGRTYALAGEAGLVMCTWPKGGRAGDWEKYWQYGYFQECMTGFEHQVAGHMVWESDEQPDLLTKGLAIIRSVHDRYHGSKRNPYNEIECSDHYARAMASYGVYLAAAGFEHDGPKAHLGFKPRMTDKGNFKSAFSSAQSWGSFEINNQRKDNDITLKVHYGELALNTLSLRLEPKGLTSKALYSKDTAKTVNSSHGKASILRKGKDITLTFEQPIMLVAGESLTFKV